MSFLIAFFVFKVIVVRCMGKTQLIKFLRQLSKEELEEQVLDLYQRYKNVKEFYDFSFKPNEDKRILNAKQRIAKEYFPEQGKKIRKRRSVAQKLIKQLIQLEVNPVSIVDLMLYNIEIAQLFTSETPINQESFYKSMLKSYNEALAFTSRNYLEDDFAERINKIVQNSIDQEWMNSEGFIISRKEVLLKE